MAGNNPFLSKQQFYTAMRLVSAAQVWHGLLHHTASSSFTWSSVLFTIARSSPSIPLYRHLQRGGGKLSEAEARSILIGLGPALPPPTMAGLEGLKTAVPQILPQVQ